MCIEYQMYWYNGHDKDAYRPKYIKCQMYLYIVLYKYECLP